MTVLWVAWAGLVASVLAAAVFAAARSFGLTRFSPGTHLGCLLLDDHRLPLTETAGLAVHLLLGSTAVPGLYALALPWIGGPGWITGAGMGLLHGGAVIAALSWMGRINRCVRAGRLPAPGRLGEGWGRHTALVIVAAGVLYGAVTGAVLGAAGSRSGAKTAVVSPVSHAYVADTVQPSLRWAYGSRIQMFSGPGSSRG